MNVASRRNGAYLTCIAVLFTVHSSPPIDPNGVLVACIFFLNVVLSIGGCLFSTACLMTYQRNKCKDVSSREYSLTFNPSLSCPRRRRTLLPSLPLRSAVRLFSIGHEIFYFSTRRSTVTLLQKLERFESTRPAIMCMNDFFQLAYERQRRQLYDISGESPMPTPATAGARAGGGGGEGGGYGCRSRPRSVHA